MLTPMTSSAVLDREFLELRAKILELAASFDRLDRGDGDVGSDPRMQLIQQGLEILQQNETGRAERVQMLFSREYSDTWRAEFGME
ncbi:MAG: hypothetical protein Tsb009_28290 [Planctomycetaceae bacterium]